MLLVIQPLWAISQSHRWHPGIVDFMRPHALYAADVEMTLRQGFNLYPHPVAVPDGFSCADLQQLLGAYAVRRLNGATQQVETGLSPPIPVCSGEAYMIETPADLTDPRTGQTEDDIREVLLQRQPEAGKRLARTGLVIEKNVFGIPQQRFVMGYARDEDQKEPIATGLTTTRRFAITTDPPELRGFKAKAALHMKERPLAREDTVNLLVKRSAHGRLPPRGRLD